MKFAAQYGREYRDYLPVDIVDGGFAQEQRDQQRQGRAGKNLRAVLRDWVLADERFLARVTGSSARTIRRFMAEPFQDVKFAAQLKCAEEVFRRFHLSSAEVYAKKVLIQ